MPSKNIETTTTTIPSINIETTINQAKNKTSEKKIKRLTN